MSVLLWMAACKSKEARETPASSAPSAPSPQAPQAVPAPFFQGTPKQAFEHARALKKPVFLYWGAVWCPPCNDLKLRVFSKPRFTELMEPFVPVYLDGDGEEAQAWADRFHIAAYPTLLILGPDGAEQMRLSTALDIEELGRAISLFWSQNNAFESAIQNVAGAGETSPEALRLLASTDFSALPADRFPSARRLPLLHAAWQRASKAGLVREQAVFASELLQGLIEEQDSAEPWIIGLKAGADLYFQSILSDPIAAWSARIFTCTWVKPSLAWRKRLAERRLDDAALKTLWLKAAESIRAHPEATVELKLLCAGPALEFAEAEALPAPLSNAIQQDILARVEEALAQAKAPHERHAVLGHAAFFLKRLGEADRARALLLEDTKTSPTPWYSYSSLASLEEQLGHADQALIWSEKARKTATGRASRLQWIANDIVLNARLNAIGRKSYIIEALEDYYGLALSLSDGFLGRNQSRAEQIKTALAALSTDAGIARLRLRFGARCAALAGENQTKCTAHFKGD